VIVSLFLLALLCAVGFPILRRRLSLERSITVVAATAAVVLATGATLTPAGGQNAPTATASVPPAPPLAIAATTSTVDSPKRTLPPDVARHDQQQAIAARGDAHIVVDGLQLPETGYGPDNPPTAATFVHAGDLIRVHGWAVDSRNNLPGNGVALIMADMPPRIAPYLPDKRPDVAIAIGNPGAVQSEYSIDLSTSHLSPGVHSFRVAVVAHDGYVVSAQSFAFTIR
jgi:hypothetical protein